MKIFLGAQFYGRNFLNFRFNFSICDEITKINKFATIKLRSEKNLYMSNSKL